MALATPHNPLAPFKHHRFTVDQYHGMVQAGLLQPDDRVELLHGEIIDMTPIGKEHSGVVNILAAYLYAAYQKQAHIVSIQNPILMSDYSEPQPDLTVLRFKPDFYRKNLPAPADVLLIIEVADTSLQGDRQVKLPLYAQTNIPEVWLVDLTGKTVERYTNPASGKYATIQSFKAPQSLAPAVFPGHTLPLAQVFPD